MSRNKPKVAAQDYSEVLVASPAVVSGTEAARVHAASVVAHDACKRLLHRLEPNSPPWRRKRRGCTDEECFGAHRHDVEQALHPAHRFGRAPLVGQGLLIAAEG